MFGGDSAMSHHKVFSFICNTMRKLHSQNYMLHQNVRKNSLAFTHIHDHASKYQSKYLFATRVSCILTRSSKFWVPYESFQRFYCAENAAFSSLKKTTESYSHVRKYQSKYLFATRVSFILSRSSRFLVPYGSFQRFYCAENAAFSSLVETTESYSDDIVDKVYKVVVDHSNPGHKMEIALDKLEIELTTPLVVEVLQKLHYEEKLAFRFFTWAGHRENYSHESQAYNEMIDILSSTKYKVKQFRVVCDLLDYMKRNDKSLVPLEVLLKILRQYTEKHLTHLHKFARKKKIRVKTQPEVYAFNLLLDALCKCCLVEEAETLFKQVKSKVKPTADTYNILFFGWCRVRNPDRAMSILEQMINIGHTPDNFAYNTAIETFCTAGMVMQAAELLEFMRTKGSTMSSPTAKTYTIMIVALVQNDMMVECYKVLGDMLNSGCIPDVSTYKELIEGMCLSGKTEAAYKLLEEMGNKGYPADIVTYNCFLKVLCDNKERDEALRLYQKMTEVACVPSVQTYNMLIVMFFRMGDVDGAFETWHEMSKRGCVRVTETYCVMIEGLFDNNATEEACFLLEEAVNRGMKLPYCKFDSFLMRLSAIGDLRAIHKLSEHMRTFYNPAMARRFAINQKRKSMSLRGKGK